MAHDIIDKLWQASAKKIDIVRNRVYYMSILHGCRCTQSICDSCAAISVFFEVKIMDYLSIAETAKKWGLSKRRVQTLCTEGRIPGVTRLGTMWAIPVDAEKPSDARVKSGNYIGFSAKRKTR